MTSASLANAVAFSDAIGRIVFLDPAKKLCYSCRRAAKGSTRHARIAGTQAARIVITNINPAQAANMEGASDAVGGRTGDSIRAAATAIAVPAIVPAPTSRPTSRAT